MPPFVSKDREAIYFPGPHPFPFTDLRRYALYWDRLEFPKNNVFDFEEYAEIDYLEAEGVLQRTSVVIDRHQEPNPYKAYILAQVQAFQRLEAAEPGLWSLGQSAADFYVPSEVAISTRTIEIELVNALPTPPDNVSLSDVLEFKNRRGSELLALRVTLDELWKKIEDSRDIPRAKIAAIDRLALSISDLDSAARESWPSRIRSSLKIELNLPKIAATGVIGLALAVGIGVPAAVVAAVGAAAAASLKLNVRDLFAPRLPAHLRDFAYVYHHVSELR